jgi:hypothetical protein
MIRYILPYHNQKKWRLLLHKLEERLFKIPMQHGWVYLYKSLPNVDWRNYSMLQLNLKSESPGEKGFQMHFKEGDGDEWFYIDDSILSNEDWITVKIPFNKFYQPKWASHGNRKMDLTDITEIGFTFNSFKKPLNNTIHFVVKNQDIFSLI